MQTAKENHLITARAVKEMIGGISNMTLWRYLHEKEYESLNFPRPVKIKTRNYWNSLQMDAWVANRLEQTEHPV